jgi:hypothetical protein
MWLGGDENQGILQERNEFFLFLLNLLKIRKMNPIAFLLLVASMISAFQCMADRDFPFSYRHYEELAKKTEWEGLYERVDLTKKKEVIRAIEGYSKGRLFLKVDNIRGKNFYITLYYHDSLGNPFFEMKYDTKNGTIWEVKYEYVNKKLASIKGFSRDKTYELQCNYDNQGRIISEELTESYDIHSTVYYTYKGNTRSSFRKSNCAIDSTFSTQREIDTVGHIIITKSDYLVDSSFFDPQWRIVKESYNSLVESEYKFSNKKWLDTFTYLNPNYNYVYSDVPSIKRKNEKRYVLLCNSESISFDGKIARTKEIMRCSSHWELFSEVFEYQKRRYFSHCNQ